MYFSLELISLNISFPGEIHGTVHKRALEQFQVDLGPGAGIILKQVCVSKPHSFLYLFSLRTFSAIQRLQ